MAGCWLSRFATLPDRNKAAGTFKNEKNGSNTRASGVTCEGWEERDRPKTTQRDNTENITSLFDCSNINSKTMNTSNNKSDVIKLPHHEQQELCQTRPPYRQGRKLTAVKVYTVNDESKHLIVCGVPKLQLKAEVKRLLSPYGDIKKIRPLPDYPSEAFTEAFHIHYARIQSARIAKRFVDCKNFYGGSLHVCYAPEQESISETREKLAQRRKDVAVRIKRHKEDPINPRIDSFVPVEQFERKKRRPALPLTEQRLAQKFPGETSITIYNGIPREIDPRPVSEPSIPGDYQAPSSSSAPSFDFYQPPYQPNETIFSSTIESLEDRKRRNYKGRTMKNSGVKNIVFRPELVDTRTLKCLQESGEEKNTFANVKKVDKGITIKILAQSDGAKKRILIKDSSVTQLVKPSDDLETSIQSAKEQVREAMQMRENR